ncbi:MAG TPA: beta-galactosidase [Candidatus Saccharimonadales bacterium]|nr:beta-galactosidase [Candidatus Saccharimonadales bacterium]
MPGKKEHRSHHPKHQAHHHKKSKVKAAGWWPLISFGRAWRRLRKSRWWIRWPAYIIIAYAVIVSVSWLVDEAMPKVKDPQFGVSFSIEYAEELGNNWRANYQALLNDLGFKRLRLMSYWELVEPQKGKYDFKDLDWQFAQANAHHAKITLAIGLRQPRWPECHEPNWAKADPIESAAWKANLYSFITTVVNHYKNNPALESYQLENEPENNWFGGCREGAAPKSRLSYEFNMVKKLDPSHPVWMSLSDEHGLPLGKPVPDAYGFSIYRVVYSTNTPIHFYITYPITDWYHRLRVWLIKEIQHRPVYVHELQLEPWGSKPTEDLTIAQQNKSMSVAQIHKSIAYSEKTGIRLQYMWGGEWWYWRKTHFNDSGPWNAIKEELKAAQANSN